MGKFAERQEWLKDAKETRRLSRDKLGSFFYDLAKIVFTTLVVGGLFALVFSDGTLETGLCGAVDNRCIYHMRFGIYRL